MFQCVLIGVSHFKDFVKFGGKCGFFAGNNESIFCEICGILWSFVRYRGFLGCDYRG